MELFKGLFDTELIQVISITDFFLCLGTSLLAGLIIALCYMVKTRYTKSFVVTLALLPAVVCVVIMMVNGNIGAGVAVAGAFSLVRFRSVPGTAREIGTLFLAMGAGLISGMGYLAYSLLFTAVACAIYTLYNLIPFGTGDQTYKTLQITVPEDLNYSDAFTDIFTQYCTSCQLTKVKTTNMGSLFRLSYNVHMKDPSLEKEMIDALRCRNGNLEISLFHQENTVTEL